MCSFNGFQSGDVCISILHPPVDDPQSGELPSERWNPTQNVRYINIPLRIFQRNATLSKQRIHIDISNYY